MWFAFFGVAVVDGIYDLVLLLLLMVVDLCVALFSPFWLANLFRTVYAGTRYTLVPGPFVFAHNPAGVELGAGERS